MKKIKSILSSTFHHYYAKEIERKKKTSQF